MGEREPFEKLEEIPPDGLWWDNEEWKPIKDYEGYYAVSTEGRVYSCVRRVPWSRGTMATIGGQMLKSKRGPSDNNPHLRVNLCVDGVPTSKQVARLVLEAFVGPPGDGDVLKLRNGRTADVGLDNVMWGPRKLPAHMRKRQAQDEPQR